MFFIISIFYIANRKPKLAGQAPQLSLARQIAAIKGKKSARLENPPTYLPAQQNHFELPGKGKDKDDDQDKEEYSQPRYLLNIILA